MISFACRQCGKRFDRPASASGTVVFCDCGAGTRVPFESSLPPLPGGAAPPPPPPPPAPNWGEAVGGPAAWEDWPYAAPRPPDPSACFHHPGTPMRHTCAACRLPFCADCVVTLRGEVLCGPCKNFRLLTLQRGPRVSVMAIFAPLVALVAGGVWFFVMLMAVGAHAERSTFRTLGGIGLLPQVVAFTLGALSWHSIETEGGVGGREWALTGLVAAVVCATLILVAGFFGHNVVE